jgi:hypothetical protein
VGVAETLTEAVQGRLKTVRKRLGKIFGLMVPTSVGGRTHHALTRVRVWDKNLPARRLGALPKPTWLRPWPHRGQERLATPWHAVVANSPATRRRWPWTGVGDDRVFKQSGHQLGLVGTWDRGQAHRVRRGMDGRWLVVVRGEGKRVLPVDFTVRRPDPVGPGRPCRAQLTGLQVRRDRTGTAWQRLGLALPAPLVVADRGFGDSQRLAHVAHHQRGTVVVEGQRPEVCQWSDGRRVTGQERRTRAAWPWRDRRPLPRRREGRFTAPSPTCGPVTVVIGKAPRQEGDDRLCHATPLTAPRLIRAWKRRRWIAHDFRTLTPLLATDGCPVQGADADDGPRVWRLSAGLGRLSTARRLVNGRVTMAEIVFSLKHHGRFLHAQDLE